MSVSCMFSNAISHMPYRCVVISVAFLFVKKLFAASQIPWSSQNHGVVWVGKGL